MGGGGGETEAASADVRFGLDSVVDIGVLIASTVVVADVDCDGG